MPIKSFRGKIADSDIDTISLSTNNGETGYRIKKLELLPTTAGLAVESVVKIYSIPQTTATADIDFSDNTLLSAGIIEVALSLSDNMYLPKPVIVFDNMTFNQDIFITVKGVGHTESINYYLELEQVKLSLDENTVATLKDIKNIEQSRQ